MTHYVVKINRKTIIIIIVAILLAFAIIYGISALSGSGGQVTDQVVTPAASGNLPGMVGGC